MAQKEISSESTEPRCAPPPAQSSPSSPSPAWQAGLWLGCPSPSGGGGLEGERLGGRVREEGEEGGSSLSPVRLEGVDLEGSLKEKAYF